MQIPLFMQTIEDVAGEWFHVLKKSNCGINIENIILLNEPHHWQTFFEARSPQREEDNYRESEVSFFE